MTTETEVSGLVELAARVTLPVVSQDGVVVGRAERALSDMLTVEAFVDEAGTVWTPPTAWAYFAACRAKGLTARAMPDIEDALQRLRDHIDRMPFANRDGALVDWRKRAAGYLHTLAVQLSAPVPPRNPASE